MILHPKVVFLFSLTFHFLFVCSNCIAQNSIATLNSDIDAGFAIFKPCNEVELRENFYIAANKYFPDIISNKQEAVCVEYFDRSYSVHMYNLYHSWNEAISCIKNESCTLGSISAVFVGNGFQMTGFLNGRKLYDYCLKNGNVMLGGC